LDYFDDGAGRELACRQVLQDAASNWIAENVEGVHKKSASS